MLEKLPLDTISHIFLQLRDNRAFAKFIMAEKQLYTELALLFVFERYCYNKAPEVNESIAKMQEEQARYNKDLFGYEQEETQSCQQRAIQEKLLPENVTRYWQGFNMSRFAKSCNLCFITNYEQAEMIYKAVINVKMTGPDIPQFNLSTFVSKAASKEIEINTNAFRSMLSLINIDGVDRRAGNTPLHLAVAKDNRTAAEVLLAANASTDIQNNNGQTPLHFAALKQNPTFVNLLSKYNADPAIADKNGLTPHALARKDSHFSCAKALEVYQQSRS